MQNDAVRSIDRARMVDAIVDDLTAANASPFVDERARTRGDKKRLRRTILNVARRRRSWR